jgi:hypothetical protein
MPFIHNDGVDPKGSTMALSAPARASLQCNILYATGNLFSEQVFARGSASEIRKWMKAVGGATGEAHAPGDPRGLVGKPQVNWLFTASGLLKLGLSEAQLKAMDPGFQRGARDAQTLSSQRPRPEEAVGKWGQHAEPWDVAVLVHRDGAGAHVPDPALPFVRELGNSLDDRGNVITSATIGGGRYNVFGYRDGLSMNVYEGNSNHKNYDPRRPLSTLLAPDPLVAGGFGSYFVFRKYQQHVERFEQRVAQMVATIMARSKNPGNGVRLEDRYPIFTPAVGNAIQLEPLVRAWLMGRAPDGKPLAGNVIGLNDYVLSDDPNGKGCPFHAHSAKMNPRGRAADVPIARRGISYGNRGAAETGILFWCAQSSIEDYFEKLMRQLANSDDVDRDEPPNPDIDNLIGRPSPTNFEDPKLADKYPANSKRYERWKGTIDIDFNVWDAVTLCGSEYLFAPSLVGVDALLSGTAQNGGY